MSQLLINILAFIVAIGLLVTVHEFGHYWVARRLGIKVLRFSVGFGKPIWSRIAGPDRTEYAISNIPIGGYVKMLDERDCEVAPHERHRAFNRQPVPSRIAVLVAGPAANFLFAVAAFWLMFMVGVQGFRPVVGDVEEGSYAAVAGVAAGDEIVSVGGRRTDDWQDANLALLEDLVDDGVVELRLAGEDGAERTATLDVGEERVRLTEPGMLLRGLGIYTWPRSLEARIGQVHAGTPAEAGGLEAGDLVLAADGVPIENWNGWREFVRARPGQTVELLVERSGEQRRLTLQLDAAEDGGESIGFSGTLPAEPDVRGFVERHGPIAAIGHAVVETVDMTTLTLRMLWRMVTGDVSAKNLSGPINIAQYAGATASVGAVPFLNFLAIVSISLGILNLMPVPMLDGGQILFNLVEAAKGSPLSARAEMLGQQVGLLMLLMLMSVAFYNDIARLIG